MTTEKTSFWNTSMTWGQMRFVQKTSYVCKNILNLCAFGFLFPNLAD